MSDTNDKGRFELPRYAQLAAAGLAAGVTGMATAIKATNVEFRQKLTAYFRFSGETHPKADRIPELQRIKLDEKIKKAFECEELKDIFEAHGIALENAGTSHANRMFATADANERHRLTWKYIQESHDLKDIFAEKLDKFAELLGFETKGLNGITRGTWQKFNFMGGETKKQIAFDIVIASLVGAAGTLMFTNSLNTHKKLTDMHDDQKRIQENQEKLLDELSAGHLKNR